VLDARGALGGSMTDEMELTFKGPSYFQRDPKLNPSLHNWNQVGYGPILYLNLKKH
jgi:hypothetical protein